MVTIGASRGIRVSAGSALARTRGPMSISLQRRPGSRTKPRIVVFGVGGGRATRGQQHDRGGAGGVRVRRSQYRRPAMAFAKTDRRVQLPAVLATQGLGAGAHPEIGMEAAEESIPEIGEHLDGAHGVHHCRHGRRHRNRSRPDHRQVRPRARHLDGGAWSPSPSTSRAGPPPHAPGRRRHRRGCKRYSRHPDRHSEPEPVTRVANGRTTFARSLRHGRPGAALRAWGAPQITDLMVLPA